jgi:MoaA/NifB/PqqE/SkfB family radical SAM enzyme
LDNLREQKMHPEPSKENIKLSEKEFSGGRVRLKCFPQVLITFATDSCNLRCTGCDFGSRIGKKITISEKGYQRVFDIFRYLDYIMITGAEMFFDAGNPEHYVQKIFTKGLKYPHLRFVGVTNGTLITPERAKLIVDKFEKIGISIDSPIPDVYKTIRIGSNLPLVTENIKLISELKSKEGLKRTDRPAIYLNFIIMARTYKNLLEMVHFARDVGAMVITLQAPWQDTYTDENIFNDSAMTEEYIELSKEAFVKAQKWDIGIQDRTRNTIMKYIPQLKNRLEFSDNVLMDEWPNCCRLPWTELYITERGDVLVCCTSKTYLGNINEQSITEIWNSKELVALRKRILKGNYVKDCKINCCRGYVLPNYYKKVRSSSLLKNIFTAKKRFSLLEH